ncbi:MAG: MATE family efflux transporter, partial [Gemmatimonadota bacterium]|nr:MATE family efflux transporter [Gemmatimonadota bacterium]
VGMIFQTLYYLVDLYFVAQLGDAALAGVGAAGIVQFIILALTQVLGVGSMVLIAHAAGRKDQADANLVFNQSLLLALIAAMATLGVGYLFGRQYVGTIAADAETTAAGGTYLFWFLPAMALQFALVAMGSALRGTGITKPTMIVQMASVAVNAALAPVLIAGWGTGRPLGVAGAGLASTIAVASGVLMLLVYFVRLEHYVRFDPAQFKPRLETWMRMLRIGIPAGGEFALMFVTIATIYWLTRDKGAAAQAGFGVGSRVMQAVFLPAMAIAFAAAPIAGQNVAAGKPERARETFSSAVLMGSVLMITLTLLCQVRPDWLVHGFSSDAAVLAVAAQFLAIVSWNFVASGVVFTCSGMFQALGNTVPTVISSATRLLIWLGPALWVTSAPDFQLRHLWYVGVGATNAHALFALWLLRREVAKRGDLRLVPAVA